MTPTITKLRALLEDAAREAARLAPDGSQIEHMNHRILEIAHELGRKLNARALRRAAPRRIV